MRQVGELSDITNSQIGESRAQYWKAEGCWHRFRGGSMCIRANGSATESRGRAGVALQSSNRGDYIFETSASQQFLIADDDVKLQRSIENLPSELREIAERSLVVSEGKRFFHWELEFQKYSLAHGPGPNDDERLEVLGSTS